MIDKTEALAVLSAMQWSGEADGGDCDTVPGCPFCDAPEDGGEHAPDCRLGLLMQALQPRSPEQIVEEANTLAQRFAEMDGLEAEPGFLFYQARTGRTRRYWLMADTAMQVLQHTSPDDALSDLPDGACTPLSPKTQERIAVGIEKFNQPPAAETQDHPDIPQDSVQQPGDTSMAVELALIERLKDIGFKQIANGGGTHAMVAQVCGWDIVVTGEDGDLPQPSNWMVGLYPTGDWTDEPVMQESVSSKTRHQDRGIFLAILAADGFAHSYTPAQASAAGSAARTHPLAEVREEARQHREQARHGLAMSSRMLDDLTGRLRGGSAEPDGAYLLDALLDLIAIVNHHQYALAARQN